MAKKKASTIWDRREMKLTRVDDGGDADHPKVYLIFEAILTDQEILDFSLDNVGRSGADSSKKVPLNPAVLGYGEGFKVKVDLAAADPEQGQMFEPGTILGPLEAESVVSAMKIKRHENIAFIAGVRARLDRMRIVMNRYDGWQKAPKRRPLKKAEKCDKV